MKIKSWFPFILLLLGAVLASAQPTNKPTFIKGGIDIKYASRASSPPPVGVKDRYVLSLNMSDRVAIRGTIEHAPLVLGTFDRIIQPASLNYQLECDVVNPNNTNQIRNVGRLYGLVPINTAGAYNFSEGSLKFSTYAIGTAQAFDGKFTGVARGKPLIKPKQSLVNRVKQEALSLSRNVKGQTVAVSVKSYDIMKFDPPHKLGVGPVQSYPDATVTGAMIYDRDKYIWFFKDVSVVYLSGGVQRADKLSGNIRWVEQPRRGGQRDGEYQFDIRFNEPPPNESAAFNAVVDETAFFQTDESIAALTGTMKYKDTFNGDTVVASAVTVDLSGGTKLTVQQTMNMLKLVFLTCLVPVNAE